MGEGEEDRKWRGEKWELVCQGKDRRKGAGDRRWVVLRENKGWSEKGELEKGEVSLSSKQ